jgi:hypothetical protein
MFWGWPAESVVVAFVSLSAFFGLLAVISGLVAGIAGHREAVAAKVEAAKANEAAAQANQRAEASKADIAAANARAAETELRIKKLEPRNLNWTAFVDALRDAPQSKVEVLYYADDFDSMALAQQIALAIKAAGWEEPFRGPIKRPADWTQSTPMAVDGQPTGVTVVGRRGPERETVTSGTMLGGDVDPTTSLGAMQRAVLLGTGRAATWTNGPHAPPYGTIRIVVAPRE